MGHLVQVECQAKNPSGCSFGLLWLRKLEKEIEKDLESNETLIDILFIKIMENRRKGRWKVTVCMWGGNWRKMMENEENRGLIDKKEFEDQFIDFL